MSTPKQKVSPGPTVELPWYDLIDDPEPPEDAMQQFSTIFQVMEILKSRYENDPTVLWSEQTNIVYDSNVPGSFVAPDGYVVFGVDAETIELERRSYRIDEWGQPPAFVLEVASESTANRDLEEKREIYARMHAQEYWRLDRSGEHYGEPLVGERLVEGQYQRFPLHQEDDGDLWSRSEVLGIDFVYRVERGVGRFLLRDSANGEWLNSLGHERSARQAAEEQALRERDLRLAAEQRAQRERDHAEARIQELTSEIERLRRER